MKKKKKNLKVLFVGIIAVLIILCIYFGVSLLTGNAIIKAKTTDSTAKTASSSGVKTVKESASSLFQKSTSPPVVTDFYGSITIKEQPAIQGVIVYALTAAGDVCGTFNVQNQTPGIGLYGFLHCWCGGERPLCSGDSISFVAYDGVSNISVRLLGPDNTIFDEGIHNVNIADGRSCYNGVSYVGYKTCSGTRYCSDGNKFENWCWECGCPSGQTCKKLPGSPRPVCVGPTPRAE